MQWALWQQAHLDIIDIPWVAPSLLHVVDVRKLFWRVEGHAAHAGPDCPLSWHNSRVHQRRPTANGRVRNFKDFCSCAFDDHIWSFFPVIPVIAYPLLVCQSKQNSSPAWAEMSSLWTISSGHPGSGTETEDPQNTAVTSSSPTKKTHSEYRDSRHSGEPRPEEFKS